MVVGIVIYQFELNQSESGDIEPEFKVIVSSFSHEKDEKDKKIEDQNLISLDDQYGLFFSHTTGLSYKKKAKTEKNYSISRLKETPYKVFSLYHQELESLQYLVIAFFKPDEEVEIFESILCGMGDRLKKTFGNMVRGNLKDQAFLNKIEEEMVNELKYTIFQMDRLSNLSKTQKAALIFSTPERIKTLELLRHSPISRKNLRMELENITPNPNIDIIITPFIELNIVRRDWAHGFHDKKIGAVVGEGEYLFLTKDIALIRKPPIEIVEQMKKDDKIGSKYLSILSDFYINYNPFSDLIGESKILSKFLLDPDILDFLGLLQTRYYPMQKLPKITSEFADIEKLVQELIDAKILVGIDDGGRKWICSLCEISPMIIFPEYLLASITKSNSPSNISEKQIGETQIKQNITPEVAQMALNILEMTYNEKIEF